MGFWNLFRGADTNEGVKTWKVTPGAILLDVRTADEYRQGRIQGTWFAAAPARREPLRMCEEARLPQPLRAAFLTNTGSVR